MHRAQWRAEREVVRAQPFSLRALSRPLLTIDALLEWAARQSSKNRIVKTPQRRPIMTAKRTPSACASRVVDLEKRPGGSRADERPHSRHARLVRACSYAQGARRGGAAAGSGSRGTCDLSRSVRQSTTGKRSSATDPSSTHTRARSAARGKGVGGTADFWNEQGDRSRSDPIRSDVIRSDSIRRQGSM